MGKISRNKIPLVLVASLLIMNFCLFSASETVSSFDASIVHWKIDQKNQHQGRIAPGGVDPRQLITQINETMILGYLQNLTAFGPRVTGTQNCTAAASYLYTTFKQMGLDVRYQNWSSHGYNGSNVEATLYGVNQSNDQIYIICGHYDTFSFFAPGSPGADDDGSGIAAVLAAANVMSKYAFNSTIRFIAFSGEEEGLLGSYAYAEEATKNYDNIVAVLAGDMIGYVEAGTDENFIRVYDNNQSSWITSFTVTVSILYHDEIGFGIIHCGYSPGTDYASFQEFGYGAIWYAEDCVNPYGHSPDDTIAHMNIAYNVKAAKLMLATLVVFGLLPPPPHIKPQLEIKNITGGLDISAVVKNNGPVIAKRIQWNITVTGGLVMIPRSINGTLAHLTINQTTTISLYVFGVGFGIFSDPPRVTIKVTCAAGSPVERNVNIRIFFYRVTLLQM